MSIKDSSDRFVFASLAVLLILSIATGAVIYLFFGSENWEKHPYLRTSIVLSLLTILWSFVFAVAKSLSNDNYTWNAITYGFVCVPFNILIALPFPEDCGSRMPSFIVVMNILHLTGLSIMLRNIRSFIRTRLQDGYSV